MKNANPRSDTRRVFRHMFHRILAQALACSLLLAPFFTTSARADWPSDKVIRIIVPFAAGGATDLLGRALGAELGKGLKQGVIVENRAGAGGSLGAQAVAASPADGYTLLLASGSMFTVNQFIYGKLPYSLENFSPIGKVASGPMVVTVNAGLPVKTTRELISYAKEHPGKLSFASAGVGSQTHIAGEAFADRLQRLEGRPCGDHRAGGAGVGQHGLADIEPARRTDAFFEARAGRRVLGLGEEIGHTLVAPDPFFIHGVLHTLDERADVAADEVSDEQDQRRNPVDGGEVGVAVFVWQAGAEDEVFVGGAVGVDAR